MSDELPRFGDENLDQEINKEISTILNNLKDDIVDIVQSEKPTEKEPTALPAPSAQATQATQTQQEPSGSSTGPDSSNDTNPANNAPGARSNGLGGGSGNPNNNTNSSGKSNFWGGLWDKTKKVWNAGKNAVGGLFNRNSSQTPLSAKIGYGLGGTWGNFKRGWDKGVKYRGKTWESFCSDKISEVLLKEECQDYFELFTENKKISLRDYSRTSEPVNYYIEEALYGYLSELNWTGTIVEDAPPEPMGVSPVEKTDGQPEIDPLANLKRKIEEKIAKYRTMIANLLKSYASKIVKPAEPATTDAEIEELLRRAKDTPPAPETKAEVPPEASEPVKKKEKNPKRVEQGRRLAALRAAKKAAKKAEEPVDNFDDPPPRIEDGEVTEPVEIND